MLDTKGIEHRVQDIKPFYSIPCITSREIRNLKAQNLKKREGRLTRPLS